MNILTDHLYQGKYDEPLAKEVCECDCCGYTIYEGDHYYEIMQKIICSECIKEFGKQAQSK